MNLSLEAPSRIYKDSFLAALNEFTIDFDKLAWIYLGENEPLDTPIKDFDGYVTKQLSTETKALPDFVRGRSYWAVKDGEVVGRISLRYELNERLSKIGGHIGYIVRESCRRQGVATEMLRLILKTDHAISIGRLLLTCDENNLASEKTILKNGGVFESLISNGNKPRKKRFWIEV